MNPPSSTHPPQQFKENVSAKVDGANTGGLTSRLTGLNLFIPVSQLEKQGSGDWWTEEVGGKKCVC